MVWGPDGGQVPALYIKYKINKFKCPRTHWALADNIHVLHVYLYLDSNLSLTMNYSLIEEF